MKKCIAVVLCQLLLACVGNNAVVKAPLPKPVLATPAPELSIADKFVVGGEYLFEQGRLIQPEQDNAYLRFSAALMMEPNHAAARSGLQAILLAELGIAREAMATSQFGAAQQQLDQLAGLYPNEPLVRDLQAELALRKKQLGIVSRPKRSPQPGAANRIYLDKTDLSQKNEQIKHLLTAIAQQVKAKDEGVMIYARSDAEGRWIYQQMRDAVPGYRIRGDIAIAEPAIRLLSPFE